MLKPGQSKSGRQPPHNSKNGQILILVLFFFVVAVTTTAVLAALWHVEIQLRSLEKNGQSAFYLAQAGIEEAKACVKNNPLCSGAGPKYLGAGRYNFTVAVINAGSRSLAATGELLDVNSNVVASKRIEVRVDGVGVSPYQSADTWREK